jgi:hypothetical protein
VDGVSPRWGTVVDTMQGRVEDEAGRSISRMRPLATPIEVAAYLQVPVKTLYSWRYREGVLAHVVSAAISGTAGRMWRRGLHQRRLADEIRPLPPTSPVGITTNNVSSLRVFSGPISLPAAMPESGS